MTAVKNEEGEITGEKCDGNVHLRNLGVCIFFFSYGQYEDNKGF